MLCSSRAALLPAVLWLQQPRLLYHVGSSLAAEMDGKIGADAGEVADLLDSTLAQGAPATDDGRPTRLLTTRREALSLYREILRYSNLFVWRDDKGRMWREVIRSSARAEYEAARAERDPELINRMIITAREAVQRTVSGFMKKRAQIVEQEASSSNSSSSSPWGGTPGG